MVLLVVAVALAAGCSGTSRDQGATAPTATTSAATQTTPTATVSLYKSCLHRSEAGKAFHFQNRAGATLVGVALGAC
jgi:hypothetical protein